jgi:hypothetical protein
MRSLAGTFAALTPVLSHRERVKQCSRPLRKKRARPSFRNPRLMGEVGRESSSDLEWDLMQRAARDYGILLRSMTKCAHRIRAAAEFLNRARSALNEVPRRDVRFAQPVLSHRERDSKTSFAEKSLRRGERFFPHHRARLLRVFSLTGFFGPDFLRDTPEAYCVCIGTTTERT